MQPTKLKVIARDAALRGDTKTLFHTLDLLERLLPIATFMDFCTELEDSACRGRVSTNKSAGAAGADQPSPRGTDKPAASMARLTVGCTARLARDRNLVEDRIVQRNAPQGGLIVSRRSGGDTALIWLWQQRPNVWRKETSLG